MFVITRAGAARLAAMSVGLALFVPQSTPAKDRTAGDVTPPRIIEKFHRPPEFPPAAKAARFLGEVTVRVTVLPTGMPANILVVHSSHPKVGFEEAAVAAVEKWRFIPAMHRGMPVEYETQFRLTFGRHGVGVAGSRDVSAVDRRTDATNQATRPPAERPRNTGAGTRTSPSRR